MLPPTLSPPYKNGTESLKKIGILGGLLDHDPTLPQYWSEHPRDRAFRASCNAFSSKFTGFSICHNPIYRENTLYYLATRHAIYSGALSAEATAAFMFLPSWNRRNKRTSKIHTHHFVTKFCTCANSWGSLPSGQLRYAKVPL